jgi:actin-related protein
VTSDTTLNKQEIAKQTLDNEQQVGENVIKEDINQEINNAPIIQFLSFDKSCRYNFFLGNTTSDGEIYALLNSFFKC